MNREGLRFVLAGAVGLLLAGGPSVAAAEEVVTNLFTCPLACDTQRHLTYVDDANGRHLAAVPLLTVTNATVDLLGLAYNNSANWTAGGEGDALPSIRLVEMDAHGTPALVTNWTDTIACTNIACAGLAGVTNWVSDRQAFYRAELLAANATETVTNALAYFDFSASSDITGRTLSCFANDQATFYLHYNAQGNPQYRVTARLVDTNGTVIGSENYTLEYDAEGARPGANLDVRVNGVNAWGGSVVFKNAPLFSEFVVASNRLAQAIAIDSRRHLGYVDDADGNHIDTVTVLAVTNVPDEFFAFAYNNTANWLKGGDADVAYANVHVTEMHAHGQTNNPSAWTDTACVTNFPGTAAEEVRSLANDRRAFYRAELLVDKGDSVETNAVVYFDFSAVASLKQSVSVFTADQVAFWREYGQGGWITRASAWDAAGHELTPDVDFGHYYSEAHQGYLLQGLGANWGGRYLITKASYRECTIDVKKIGSELDTRRHLTYLDDTNGWHLAALPLVAVTNAAVDLLGLAYNNTTNWTQDGSPDAPPPVIRLVEMDAHGTPALVTNWTDTIAGTTLDCADLAGVTNWVSDRRAYYRAELLVTNATETVTNALAYLDFDTCSDIVRPTLSCFRNDQATFLLHYDPTKDPAYSVVALLVDFQGNSVGSGNFVLTYDSTSAVPGATIDVRVDGTNAWGGAVLFEGVPLFTEFVVSSNRLGQAVDTRRHLTYVDDADRNHTNTVTLIAVTNALDELLAFAYNNTTNWVNGGDAHVAYANVHVTEMNAHGQTNNPSAWTDTWCETNFPGLLLAEETQDLTSDRKAFYRAELLVEKDDSVETNAIVYIDFSACVESVKETVSVFATNQVALWMDYNAGTWYPTGHVWDPEGNELTEGTDYSLYYSPELRRVYLQGIGADWGGRYVVTKPSWREVTVSAGMTPSPCDTRRCLRIVRPETGDEAIYLCRAYESADDVQTFAYDTDWVSNATEVTSVTVAPCVEMDEADPRVRILDEGRRDGVAAGVTTAGTNDWPVVYKGYYEARLVEKVSDGLSVTNLVDIDLGAVTNRNAYPGVDVAYADGTSANFLTIWQALAAVRTNDVAAESVNLRVDRVEDLVLDGQDDVVFLGGAFTLDGAFTVPTDAHLTILSGTYTTNPEQPGADYVPRGCTTTADKKEPGTWTVEPDWLVGLLHPGDVVAYLTGDSGNGTLKVLGAGEMRGWADAADPRQLPPWEAYDSDITNVAVGVQVTSIGSEAFSNCVNLVSVGLPGGILDVGRGAFSCVNADGAGGAEPGFVQVTYVTPKAVASTNEFQASEMRMASGLLTGGTYDYEPLPREIDPDSVAEDNKNDTWSIVKVFATVSGGEREKTACYGAVSRALADVGEGETLTLTNATAHLTAAALNQAYANGRRFTIGGNSLLDVSGVLTNGVFTCPFHVSLNASVTNEIAGGDFYGIVHAPSNSISGGTFSVRPDDAQLKAGCAIVEVQEGETTRYRVVRLAENGVPYPQVVGGLSYKEGVNQVGILVSEGVTVREGGTTNATEIGVYAATFDPADGKCWPTGDTAAVTLTWGIAPPLAGVQTGYDPVTGGWKITLTNDLTSTLEIPDSFGALVNGKVELDLNGYAIRVPKAVWQGDNGAGAPAVRIVHAAEYASPALDLTVTGPGTLAGGDGADGISTHKTGGTGAPTISVDAQSAASAPTCDGTVMQTPGSNGFDYAGGDSGLLTTIIDSRDEYLAIAIPYAHTNDTTGVTKPTLDSLICKDELAAGDEAYVYNHDDRSISKYGLDDQKVWKPLNVYEVTEKGWTIKPADSAGTLEPGYGFWLRRVEESHRANIVCIWGHEWTGYKADDPDAHWEVSLTPSDGTKRGKTLVSNPYGGAWDPNDATRGNLKDVAVEGDWILLNGAPSTIFEYKGGRWEKITLFSTRTAIPLGYGFWYTRATNATEAATLRFK